jgi:hypothetical protein
VTTFNKSPIPQSSAVTTLDARSSESGDTSNWVWSPWSLAVFRCGGLAASFGGVTCRDHKAEGSSASHWSGSGRRNNGRVSGAMVAGLSGAGGRKNSGTPDHHRWCRKGKRVEIWRCLHPNPFLELMTSKVSFPKLQERHMNGVAQELGVVEDWDNPTTNQEFCQNRGW